MQAFVFEKSAPVKNGRTERFLLSTLQHCFRREYLNSILTYATLLKIPKERRYDLMKITQKNDPLKLQVPPVIVIH
jgi:hypothetical protein